MTVRSQAEAAPPVQAVIFDCDGTLVDSESIGTALLAEHFSAFGLTLTAEEAFAAYRGRKLAECMAEVEERLGRRLPESFIPEFRAASAEAFRTRLRAIEGALDLVASLSLPICVASNGPRDKIELCLSVTGLLPYFEGRIFSAYDVGSWKPEPGLFLHAARALDVDPADCLVVEDSPVGVAAAQAAGMRVVAYVPAGAHDAGMAGVPVVATLGEIAAHLNR